MKRSRTLTLTSLMASASLTISACDSAPQAPSQEVAANKDPVEAFAYMTLDQCKAADQVSDAECETNYQAALKDDQTNAPRYDKQATCEEVYGPGQCVPRASSGGGSFFTPLLAGFVIGRMMDGGNPYYRGTGLYRRDDGYRGGGYYTGYGGMLGRDYSTGRTVIGRQGVDPPPAVRQAPARVQTRSAVVSRGGFGGGGRSYGG
ncbi:MAG: DUF1190 domain-containing protein [Alphaproteobacteria bacterium]|nr:DUF1190 domain-containing protein [Alphaproteobacteria bacterium]